MRLFLIQDSVSHSFKNEITLAVLICNTLLSVLLRSSCLGSKVMCVKDLTQAAFVLIHKGKLTGGTIVSFC